MKSSRPVFRPLVALALSASAALLLSCGGGIDIAPSQPVAGGSGSGTVRLGTIDFGQTTGVSAGVQSVQNFATTATDDPVSFGTNGYARLAHGSLSTPVVTLTGASGAPLYLQGTNAACVGDVPPCDFWLEDAAVGLLQVRPGGPIPVAPTVVLADYSYNARLLSLSVGLTFPSGQFVSLVFYHVPSGQAAPFTIQPVAASPPPSPYDPAFNAQVQTNLTTLGSRELYTAVDDPANLATLTQLDLSNEASPCVAGDVLVKVRSDANPAPIDLDLSFASPGC